jgi:hypothetical protein
MVSIIVVREHDLVIGVVTESACGELRSLLACGFPEAAMRDVADAAAAPAASLGAWPCAPFGS